MRFALADDALTILTDWANTCLDDLESLDDLKGGALSTRFNTLSEEARNGILLSRLLYYLALPRYAKRSAERDEKQSGQLYKEIREEEKEEEEEEEEEQEQEEEEKQELSIEKAKKKIAQIGVAANLVGSEKGNITTKETKVKSNYKNKKYTTVPERMVKDAKVHTSRNGNRSSTSSSSATVHDYPRRRRQLLQRCNVQLDTPFPIYEECFGDLLNLIPSERMSLLLQFATELMIGCEFVSDSNNDNFFAYADNSQRHANDDNNNNNNNNTNIFPTTTSNEVGGVESATVNNASMIKKNRQSIVESHMAIAEELYRNVYSKFGRSNTDTMTSTNTSLGRTGSHYTNLLRGTTYRVELAEVIDPHALAMGERASLVTFMALMYVRFAHAFNHKSRRAAETEKAAILYLLSDGRYNNSNSNNSNNAKRSHSEVESEQLVEKLILSKMEDEDKTP